MQKYKICASCDSFRQHQQVKNIGKLFFYLFIINKKLCKTWLTTCHLNLSYMKLDAMNEDIFKTCSDIQEKPYQFKPLTSTIH